MYFMISLFIMCIVICMMLAGWRYFFLRPKGTMVRIRSLPAQEHHGWRHGVMIYRGEELHFYKLRSLSPFSDTVFLRSKVQHLARRNPTEQEVPCIGTNLVIIQVEQTGRTYEFALDNQAELAFTSWIESAPSEHLRNTVQRFINRYSTS